jgi:1,4-dihydroxy-2-naphthoate octaprenyltransferase
MSNSCGFSCSILWRLLRPHTLTASFLPVLTGAALAWCHTRSLRIDLLLAMLAVAALLQTATNIFNEYYDYLRGVDTVASTGIAGAITRDGLPPRLILRLALGTMALAIVPGLYLCAECGWWLFAAGVLSAMAGYFYTGGPWPIAASPLGELVSGGFMGGGIVLLACYVQMGRLQWIDAAIAFSFMLLIASILTANNIRDIEGDTAAGRHTLVILLGRERAIVFLAAMLFAAHGWIVLLVCLQKLPLWTLLSLGGVLPSVAAIRAFRRGRALSAGMQAMRRVAQVNTVFGVLLIAGLLCG